MYGWVFDSLARGAFSSAMRAFFRSLAAVYFYASLMRASHFSLAPESFPKRRFGEVIVIVVGNAGG